MAHRAPRLVVATVGALLLLLPTMGGTVAAAELDQHELELAERHAPVVWIRQQTEPCDSDGEPFEPTAADIVLDNPEVLLRQVGNEDPVVMRAPSAFDLYDLREGWFLDFPGDALNPGCVFEQDFRRFAAGRDSVVYAHVGDAGRSAGDARLAVLVLLVPQPGEEQPRGRLGVRAAALRCRVGRGGARRRTDRGGLRPTRGW